METSRGSIKGNPLPLTDVKRILKTRPVQIRGSEQEVLNYNQALQEVNTQLNKEKISFNLPLVLSLQKKIIHNLLPAHQSGRVRTQPVFVNNPHLGKTIYWPPDVQDVPFLMGERFVLQQKSSLPEWVWTLFIYSVLKLIIITMSQSTLRWLG